MRIQISSKLQECDAGMQRLEQRKKDILDHEQRARMQIQKAFDELRQRLDAKERELLFVQETQVQ